MPIAVLFSALIFNIPLFIIISPCIPVDFGVIFAEVKIVPIPSL